MAADCENMGYEALTKTISRIKMAAESDERVPEAPRPIIEIKCPPISKIWVMKPYRRQFLGLKWPSNLNKVSPKVYDVSLS